jgi:hypothetical protein
MTMGRIARLWDLKYGIFGLEFPVRDGETNHVIDTLPISKDTAKIFAFMGYDYSRWKLGFKTADELRDYLFSSPRIHRGFLDAASEATKHRKRDHNRPVFKSWYEWFETHKDQFPDKADLPLPQTTADKLAYVEEAFPESNIREKYAIVQKRIADFSAARNKFSGKHIQELFPELQARRFGAYMELWTRQWATKEEQVAYILSHDVAHLTELAHMIRKNLI